MKNSNILIPVWARIFLIIITYFFVGGIFYLIGCEIAGIPIEELSAEKQYTLDQDLIIGSADLLAIILVVFLFRKIADNKSIISLGFPFGKRSSDLFYGFIVAILILGIGIIFLIASNEIKIARITFEYTSFWKNFIILLFVAFGEEILMRGYILNNLLDSTNKYVALIISSIIFSALHIFNSHISFLSILNLFLAGILLGALYIYTRNLWFPISQHLFWNFLQGPVLGFNVSGHETDSILLLNYPEKNIINGGDFGFEGSVICTLLSLTFIGLILGWQIRKNRIPDLQTEVLVNKKQELFNLKPNS